METKLNDLFYGSLLHDIGKVVQRSTKERNRHSKIGHDYLKRFSLSKDILDQVSYHHYSELSQSNIPNNSLAYITYMADNISSGVDRRKHDEVVDNKWDSKTNLEDIFNRFGEQPTKRYFEPIEMDLDVSDVFASEYRVEFTDGDYSGIVQTIEKTLQTIDFTTEYQQSVLNLIEATMSFIPSSTNLEEVVDISLYDHSKMTTAFAMSIYEYLRNSKRENYKHELFDKTKLFYEEDAFLLASFDLSGIQNFIYTITSSGAHKQLRSRSFYLDMMAEWIVDYLLNELGFTRANLLYSGGGHAYLLLPNTEKVIDTLKTVEKSFNQFFLDYYGTDLYVAFGWHEFNAKEAMADSSQSDYRSIFRETSRMISNKKLNRYGADTINKLNEGGKRSGRECSICHRVDDLLPDDNKCQVCAKLEDFSYDIQNADFYLINQDSSGLPIGPDFYLHSTTKENILNKKAEGKVYSKNEFNSGFNHGTHLWIADYTFVENNEFSKYAQRNWTIENQGEVVTGVKRLAVLRCDVDDLGYGFIAGFSQQDGGRYNTFTRTASFSRSMSMFFKVYINQFAKDKRLTIIYSGGDDIFLLGAWDDVLDFAVELRDLFLSWTNNKLTLSAGIGLFHDKSPVNIMARETGKLEEAAKENGKDSITLFEEKNTFKFDNFIEDVYYDKYEKIKKYFDNEDEHGKAFIYRLLELIRQRNQRDRIPFARLAYLLARLEDTAKNKESFKAFKKEMVDWYDDDKQIKEVRMALELYVLSIREGE